MTNPQNTVFSVKRFMGRKFSEVQSELKRVPYKVVDAPKSDAHIEVDMNGEKKTFSPPEVSAMILAKLKSDAEAETRREDHPGGDYRASLFQRLAA